MPMASNETCGLRRCPPPQYRRTKTYRGSESRLRQNLGHDANDLCIGREATNCLFGPSNSVVDADLKGPPTRAPECHLRIWSDLADEVRRRTGARFIVSLPAVLDLDAHRLPSFRLWTTILTQDLSRVSRDTACRRGRKSTATSAPLPFLRRLPIS